MLKTLDFDWLQMHVALDGYSHLDLPRLNLNSKKEAQQFLASYGYDVEDPTVREEIWRIYFEALAFLRSQLLEPHERIPEPLLTRGPQSDVVRLLLEASGNAASGAVGQVTDMGRWCCAILRIMFIISHMDNDVRLENFVYAREQIFGRFDNLVKAAGPRRWRFGEGERAIPLVRYIKKERKDRNSIIVKLLSKPSVATEAIYDSLGFRFVTETRFDCYRLVQAMFQSGVITASHIQPGRSINTLIPSDVLQNTIESTRAELERGEISLAIVRRRIEKLEQDHLVPSSTMRNPFSSRWYRAIQFTCRQLITAPHPTFRFWSEVRQKIEASKAAAAVLKKIPITLREKRSFYYPFEIQVMDLEAYVESIGGRSRHRDYKAKQRLMARNRVLRDLI